MNARESAYPINQEAAFLDYVERLRRFTAGRLAVHIRLSELQPYHRRPHHLRIAETVFDHLLQTRESAIFRLFNDDMVIICKDTTVSEVDDFVLRLRYLFSDDPLFNQSEDEQQRFCDWFDLEHEHAKLLRLARRMVAERNGKDARANASERDPAQASAIPTKPIQPSHLGVLESAIARADLSSMIRRQPICAVATSRKPEPVYYELYTSIETLRRTLIPNVDVTANPWLFQELTRHLDRRMIAHLAKTNDATLKRAFAVNLNIATLISPAFLDFDAVQNSTARRNIVIELQLIDIFSDLGNYLFARDFLSERGYKFCLDGITHLHLPLIDRTRLGLDLIKLNWSSNICDQLDGARAKDLREAVRRIGSERLILAHCDSELALEVGKTLGIMLYQGRLLDRMISENITREELIHTMSEALARHRAAARIA